MILRSAGWAVSVLAALAAIGIASTRPLAYDLGSYTEAARRLLAGDTLYPLATRVPMYLGPGDYLWHPTTAVLFIPLALLPAPVATALWTAGLVAVAALLGHRLLRSTPADVRPWATAGYVLFLPLIAELTLGNLDLVALSLCLLAWHLRARPVVAGAVLALAVGLKPLPLLIPAFFVAAGAWRAAAWAAALGGTAVVLSLPFLADEWLTYLGLAAQIAAAPESSYIPLVPRTLEVRVALLLGAISATIGMGLLARERARARLAFAVALAAVPLAAPTIPYPYLVFALPLLATLLGAPRSWWWAAAALAWLAMEIPTRPGAPSIAFGGLVLLIVVGVIATGSRSRVPPPDLGSAVATRSARMETQDRLVSGGRS